ncbi:Ribosomal RNA small subunit methyltransferase B [Commensalibacter sp. Nvir]|uniref:RsmB/NOP family class I SAM-dependent RNA methyltransferase n=1 Tax=Commensalibacter sp. Nvir TaxID=3069817 RepID=UPI002D2C2682|nr:Ribosomal RNA small subunit methyltransferase B [Commensalibacter sp. Nvir]
MIHTTRIDFRQIAFDVVNLVLVRGLTLDIALEKLFSEQIEPCDRAAAYRLVVCFFRRKGTLEAIIKPFLNHIPPKPVLWILSLGAAQLLFLDTPAHAVISRTVELAKNKKYQKFAGLVNAVLRKISDFGTACLKDLDQPRLNIPTWLWQQWEKANFDPRLIATSLLTEPPIDLTVKPDTVPPKGGKQIFQNSYRYPMGTKIVEFQEYNKGNFWVQDSAASLPATLLPIAKGDKIADLCAAPGGKTAQLILKGGQVTAIDQDPNRVKRLKKNLQRLQLSAQIICSDASTLTYQNFFDGILLDAPCSATGILRRHPDVLHLKRPEDIPLLVLLQKRLIKAAFKYLKKDGCLIYSVCSLQVQEAEEQARYISHLPYALPMPFEAQEIPFFSKCITKEGWIRTLPWMYSEEGGIDGFFIARFKKK